MSKKIVLDGKSLKIEDIVAIVRDTSVSVEVSESAFLLCKKTEDYLHSSLNGKIIYGINTGFGPMATHVINGGQLEQLQENLIRSHAVGMGEAISNDYVLAAMVVRLNTLARGYSGVSRELLERLQFFINNRILPIVPEHGAVGTSGDLVQLAHIALALLGKGDVVYKNVRQPVSKVLATLSQPTTYKLKIKEGLALINGTSMMSGIAALEVTRAENLLQISVQNGAMAMEMVHAFADGVAVELHNLRAHRGQGIIASRLREIFASSKLLRSRKVLQGGDAFDEEVHKLPESVQEIYSLRCIPQILGPVHDAIETAENIIGVEINSVTDNPIIDVESDYIYHGGNFHGDYIAYAIDQLKMTIVKLTILSERRINFFLNENINKHFPPFMNLVQPGLTLGLQALQFVATSTTADNQTLAYPHYAHSIPTNGDNQDVVSMGTDAVLFAAKVIQNAYIVLAIELITLGQAVDFCDERDQLSKQSLALYNTLREVLPAIKEDRVLVYELPKVVEILQKVM
ncbi:MAG: aromatic amino acid ammonia-lyase [Patescibacteria group bacterium]